MGNHQSQVYSEVFVQNSWTQYIEFKRQKKISYGNYRVLKNHITTQKIQQYELFFQDEQQYNIYVQSFIWRLNKQTLVKSRYFKLQDQDKFCSSTKHVKLYLQNIPVRLSDVKDIPLAESLYILINTLKGFELIYNSIGYIKPFEDLICIDRDGKVKVWLNSNLSKNYPNAQNIVQNKNGSQSKLILNILYLIDQNTDKQQLSTTLLQYMTQNYINLEYMTFRKIYETIYKYALNYHINITDSFQSIVEIINDEEECYDTYRTELESQERFIPTHRRKNLYGDNTSSFGSLTRPPLGAAGLVSDSSGNYFRSSSYNSSHVRKLSRSQNISNNQTPMDSLISNQPLGKNIVISQKSNKSSNRKLSINSNKDNPINTRLNLHNIGNRFQNRPSTQNGRIINIKSYENLPQNPKEGLKSLKSSQNQNKIYQNLTKMESKNSQLSQKFQKFVNYQNSRRSNPKFQTDSPHKQLEPSASFQQIIDPSRYRLLNSLHQAQIRMSYNDRKGSENYSNFSNKESSIILRDGFDQNYKVKISNIEKENLTSNQHINNNNINTNRSKMSIQNSKEVEQQQQDIYNDYVNQYKPASKFEKAVKFQRKGLHKPTIISYYNGPMTNSNPSFQSFNSMKFSSNQLNVKPLQPQMQTQQIYSDKARSNENSSINHLNTNLPFGMGDSALNNLQRIRPITGRTVFEDDSSSEMDLLWRQNTNFGIAMNNNNYFGKSQNQMDHQQKIRRKSDDQIQTTKLSFLQDKIKMNWRSNIHENLKSDLNQEEENIQDYIVRMPTTKTSIRRLRESQQIARQVQLYEIDAEIASDLQKLMIQA